MSLLVLCPSHRRPQAAHDVLESFMDTKVIPSTWIHFMVWDKDPTFNDYPAFVTGKYIQEAMTARTNLAAVNHTGQGWPAAPVTHVAWIADDNRFRSKGWDRLVLDAIEGMGGGIVYGNDVVSPGTKPSHVFMSSEIPHTLGWMIHPKMRSTFFDDVWEELGRKMDRLRYLPEVVVEHLYIERDNRIDFEHDQRIFGHWRRHEAEDDARKCDIALKRSREPVGSPR